MLQCSPNCQISMLFIFSTHLRTPDSWSMEFMDSWILTAHWDPTCRNLISPNTKPWHQLAGWVGLNTWGEWKSVMSMDTGCALLSNMPKCRIQRFQNPISSNTKPWHQLAGWVGLNTWGEWRSVVSMDTNSALGSNMPKSKHTTVPKSNLIKHKNLATDSWLGWP